MNSLPRTAPLDALDRLAVIRQIAHAPDDELAERATRFLLALPGVSAAYLCLRGKVMPEDSRFRELARRCEAQFSLPDSLDYGTLALPTLLPPDHRAVPLRTDAHIHGALVIAVGDRAALASYETLITHLADVIALALESRLGRRELADAKTQLVQTRAEIDRLTHYDPFTGLLTHAAFVERLSAAIASARGQHAAGPDDNAARAAIISVAIQGFGRLMDSLNYRDTADMLQQVADRLRASVREEDIVARERGERFYVGMLLHRHNDDPDGLQKQIAAIAEVLSPAFTMRGQRRVLRFGIGVALYPIDGADIEALMLRAEAATHIGAALPRDAALPVFYSTDLSQHSRRRQAIEDGLLEAADRGEFSLAYHPKFDVGGKRLLGCEALLRWRHPTLGLVSPSEFVPIAEESGAILTVSAWATAAACGQIARWRERGLTPAPVAVNVSMRQMLSPTAVEGVLTAPEAAGIPNGMIEIEITESAAMEDARATQAFLEALRARGMSATLDDFGTGYSSLAYLFDLPFDSIKIDKRFIDRLTDAKGRALVRHIIAMAHEIDLHVVAEGVEHRGQADLLDVWGCDAIQGYIYAKPLDSEGMARLLADEDAQSQSRPA